MSLQIQQQKIARSFIIRNCAICIYIYMYVYVLHHKRSLLVIISHALQVKRYAMTT